jgi:hypothetical protein
MNGRQSKFLVSAKIAPRCRPAATVMYVQSQNTRRTSAAVSRVKVARMSGSSTVRETPRSRLFQSLQSMSKPVANACEAPELSTSLRVVVRRGTAFVSVACRLRSVASASAQNPKSALLGSFSRSRRAAHTEIVSSIRGRLAHKLKPASVASSKSVASPLRSQPAFAVDVGGKEFSVPKSAFPVNASALRH